MAKVLVIWPHGERWQRYLLDRGTGRVHFEVTELVVSEKSTWKTGAQLRMADTPHDQRTAGNDTVKLRRRRFVRGASLAGPAVITLQSGRAWAVSNCQADSQGFLGFSPYREADSVAVETDGDALYGDHSRYYGESSQIEALVNLSYSC